jgi:succinoglycan biosynthesis protein ExoM
MATGTDHICVCICTYKRAEMLAHLIQRLEVQHTDGRFVYSAVVVDNDAALSAQPVVEALSETCSFPIRYFSEPERNIALARNRSVQAAKADFVAFIDDDEFPPDNWLLTLYEACSTYRADGVLGPVKPTYSQPPPAWVVRGKFYEKGNSQTGDVLQWQQTRTSNALLHASIFADPTNRFRRELGTGGEDRDLFKRLIDQNYRFVWCEQAFVYETTPPERLTRRYMLRRAFVRGQNTVKGATFCRKDAVKSMIAIPIYIVALPFALLGPHDGFMKLFLKVVEHGGRLLALSGVNLVRHW